MRQINEKYKQMLGVVAQGISYFLMIVAIWFLFTDNSYPFEKIVMIFGPYIVAWISVSFASIAISGFRFTLFWMGSYLSNKLYSYPNYVYAFIYAVLMALILLCQYHYGVLSR
jgi:hypothetical protein